MDNITWFEEENMAMLFSRKGSICLRSYRCYTRFTIPMLYAATERLAIVGKKRREPRGTRILERRSRNNKETKRTNYWSHRRNKKEVYIADRAARRERSPCNWILEVPPDAFEKYRSERHFLKNALFSTFYFIDTSRNFWTLILHIYREETSKIQRIVTDDSFEP